MKHYNRISGLFKKIYTTNYLCTIDNTFVSERYEEFMMYLRISCNSLKIILKFKLFSQKLKYAAGFKYPLASNISAYMCVCNSMFIHDKVYLGCLPR